MNENQYTKEEQRFILFLESKPSRFDIIGYIHKYKKSHNERDIKQLMNIYKQFVEENTKRI